MQITTSRSRVVAVLGPTNTGKTHLAMERMLGHASGMIGFPLRLLARENYDRAVRIKGRNSVALITGEEKIIPQGARYFLCTVEAMPIARRVAFLGVDEIQLCADPERGHMFTQRLLGARGEEETMFMGAETIRPLLGRLIPEAEFITRPRFSSLTYTGQRKIPRLPPRSAIVAFSAADVYAIAELVRRQRGGAAVVLGALSPRTRNAQVAMYQAGEVDYLVATDAIGMGLNMDVNHVAFAEVRKFDGRAMRNLTAAEMAQIGGRAGRHMNDGTFGTTADVGALDDPMVKRMENHEFDALKQLYWRNENLRFTSLDTLRQCLAEAPPRPGLVRAPETDDERVLSVLCKDEAVAALAVGGDGVRTLWDVCRIPDFRKMMSDGHARLLARIYSHLMEGPGRLPTDWIAGHVSRIDRVDGDIETLAGRIADIRTWTTIAFHGDWLDDAAHWQGLTRQVEDRLSDALHQRLTQRFVDRRTAMLVKEMKDQRNLTAVVNKTGEVLVEGHFVGHLEGFRFQADGDSGAPGTALRAVGTAAERALRGEIARRVGQLARDGDDAFAFARNEGEGGGEGPLSPRILWCGVEVGRLVAGEHILEPGVETLAGGLLEAKSRDRIRARLAAWVGSNLARRLEALFLARQATLNPAARGLLFQLSESLGSMPRRPAAAQVDSLNREDRKTLRTLGIRLGRESIYMPALLKPNAMALRALLWTVRQKRRPSPPLPDAGRVSVPAAAAGDAGFLEAVGYRVLGGRAVRIDIIERLSARAWALSRQAPFSAGPEMLSLAGCSAGEMIGILKGLGYRSSEKDGVVTYSPKRLPRGRAAKRSRPVINNDSPFSKLRDLTLP